MNYQTLTPQLVEQLMEIAPGRVFTGGDMIHSVRLYQATAENRLQGQRTVPDFRSGECRSAVGSSSAGAVPAWNSVLRH